MPFNPFAVSTPHIFYASMGGFTVLFGMFSLFLRERVYIGEAIWAFLFGIIIGPHCGNIFDPRGWGGQSEHSVDVITLEVTRVILAIGVFAIGVELPKAYMARHWKSLFFLLVPVMTWGWFVSAGLIYALIPRLNFLSSLVVAACLTPTDPILAAAVVGGKYADKHVPSHIRHLLAAESGCNDGAAFPFLYIALYLTLDSTAGHAIRDWFLVLWLYQVVLGIVLGATIGFAFRHLMRYCQRKDLIDRQSYVAQYVALALFSTGLTTLLGSDDLLAAFSCGTAFAWDGFFNRQTEESVFSSVIDLLFNVAAFVYVGAWMPFGSFQDKALSLTVWRLVVIAILVLLLRRLPIMIALYKWIPDIKTFREAVFSGHFGPIGIGAVFISTLAVDQLPRPYPGTPPTTQAELLAVTIQPIVAFMVLCSIAIHGLSIPSFSLGKRVHSVSRTWSRHAPPDWTNQARLVERGENIVINRDSAMERGESAAPVSGRGSMAMEEAGRSSVAATITVTPEKAESMTESGQLPERAKKDNPPDGEEPILEWKEGEDKVIERRSGPGEEPEVEVVKHGFSPKHRDYASHPGSSKRSSVAEHADQHTPAPEASTSQKTTDEADGQDQSETMPTPPTADEEEGWASDASNSAKPVVASPSTLPAAIDRKKKAKAAKQKHPASSKPAGGTKGRRRPSIRRGLLGHAHQLMRGSSTRSEDLPGSACESDESDTDAAEETESEAERGRASSTAASSSQPHARASSGLVRTLSMTTETSIRNMLLAAVQKQEMRSREASPSRAVRFADERQRPSGFGGERSPVAESISAGPSSGWTSTDDGEATKGSILRSGRTSASASGYNTPRGTMSEPSPVEGPRTGTDEGDGSRTRVTFDLPGETKI